MTNNVQQVENKESGIMIRVDKTNVDLNSEKPSSRWDPSYWHPKYDQNIVTNLTTKPLIELLVNNEIISVDHMRASRSETEATLESENYPAFYYTVDGIMKTGYDLGVKRYINKEGYSRLKRGKLNNGDIAVAISGTGSVGKSFIKNDSVNLNTTGDLYVLKIDKTKFNEYCLYILFNTPYLKLQIERNEKGVSGQTKLTAEMLAYFSIPIIDSNSQKNIESQCKKMSLFHDKAMAAKAKGDTPTYERNLKTAEDMLKDLVAKTEAIIRGEREDLV